MEKIKGRLGSGSLYELLIWLIYACIFKYSVLVGSPDLPRMRMNFPFPKLILFSIAMTLYVIPFYRIISPWLLKQGRYVLLALVTIFYFLFVSRWCNWFVTWFFDITNQIPSMTTFFKNQFAVHNKPFYLPGGNFNLLLTDWLAFFSVLFMRHALDTERKKYALETQNLQLQLEILKAQLHPHFLFNTLNNIYGMSLTGSKDTPGFILKLSDMMRFVLYDSRNNRVPLEKDIEFLQNYMEMEKMRYPLAAIEFFFEGDFRGKTIAPLLLIPFVENSFKHGSHRINDRGGVYGKVKMDKETLFFTISNDMLAVNPGQQQEEYYGGVGIKNVRKRLDMFYPGCYELAIDKKKTVFTVQLKIQL
ncbi:MAG TPA: sensor histidine kinase [Chitinophagaceae bacterium]|nr:sensor histidine kinase [Chitinophagaceae bacterium]